MQFFVAAAIRGGRAQQPAYRAIVAFLQQHGTVVNAHVADETITDYGETDLTKEQIHDRELRSLQSSDLVVADVTTPSLGVGYLIAAAMQAQKTIVCLYRGTDTYKLSAMIKGDSRVTVRTYVKIEDLSDVLRSFMPAS